MEREDEITELLKFLINEVYKASNKGKDTLNIYNVRQTCEKITTSAKHMENYLQELEEISEKIENK